MSIPGDATVCAAVEAFGPFLSPVHLPSLHYATSRKIKGIYDDLRLLGLTLEWSVVAVSSKRLQKLMGIRGMCLIQA